MANSTPPSPAPDKEPQGGETSRAAGIVTAGCWIVAVIGVGILLYFALIIAAVWNDTGFR